MREEKSKWIAFLVMAVGAIAVLGLLPHLVNIILLGALFGGAVVFVPFYFRVIRIALKVYMVLFIFLITVELIKRVF